MMEDGAAAELVVGSPQTQIELSVDIDWCTDYGRRSIRTALSHSFAIPSNYRQLIFYTTRHAYTLQ